MRPRSLLLTIVCVLCLSLPAAKAQFAIFFKNSFVSVGVGPNYYLNSDGGAIGGGAELSYGKWIINTVSMRGQLSAQYAGKSGAASQLYFYGHMDIAFDLFTALRGRNPSDRFRSYLYGGVGIVHSLSGDNDFCGSFGIGADYKVADDWRIFADVGTFVHPSEFDNNSRSSLLAKASVGATYEIQSNPTRSRSRLETRSFGNDWSFMLALGAFSFNYSGVGTLGERLSLLTPAFEFGIGKRITNTWHIRLCANGLYAKSREELFSFYSVHGDIMFDVLGLFNPDSPQSLFSVCPYLSAGMISRLDNLSNFLFSTAAGAKLSWNPFDNNSLFLDARYLLTPPRFAYVDDPQSTFSVGMFSLMLGYSYTFTHNSFGR